MQLRPCLHHHDHDHEWNACYSFLLVIFCFVTLAQTETDPRKNGVVLLTRLTVGEVSHDYNLIQQENVH